MGSERAARSKGSNVAPRWVGLRADKKHREGEGHTTPKGRDEMPDCAPEVYPPDKLEIIGEIGSTAENIKDDFIEYRDWARDAIDQQGLGAKERVDGRGDELYRTEASAEVGQVPATRKSKEAR